jgi:ABC-type arginine transport system ATPase subunit
MISGLPRRAVVSSDEVREALKEPTGQIIEGVLHTLEQLEPELAADLVDSGICLAGGGALLRGIDTIIAKASGLDVRIAEDPLTCVARGTAEYLENLRRWRQLSPAERDRFRGRHIGVVLQQFHLLPTLTALQNLLVAQSIAGLPVDRAAAHSYVDASVLLSSGGRQLPEFEGPLRVRRAPVVFVAETAR